MVFRNFSCTWPGMLALLLDASLLNTYIHIDNLGAADSVHRLEVGNEE
jgi:hypothetical protein